MIWFLAIIVVIAIYNAERLPGVVNKVKKEVPHLVEVGKKVSKEIKEKAHNAQAKVASKKSSSTEENKEDKE